jgi:thioredoxin 1
MVSENIRLLLQCPCSGDSKNTLLLLAVCVGVWLVFYWIKTVIKSKGVSFMNKTTKIIVVIALIAAATVVLIAKNRQPASSAVTAVQQNANVAVVSPVNQKIPRLLDLGATKCVPCKMMKPILDELKSTYAGTLDVVFIDVWENEGAGKQYGIESIPTQIFFNETGKELYRHVGFMPKADILAKWKELGFNLEKGDRNVK